MSASTMQTVTTILLIMLIVIIAIDALICAAIFIKAFIKRKNDRR